MRVAGFLVGATTLLSCLVVARPMELIVGSELDSFTGRPSSPARYPYPPTDTFSQARRRLARRETPITIQTRSGHNLLLKLTTNLAPLAAATLQEALKNALVAVYSRRKDLVIRGRRRHIFMPWEGWSFMLLTKKIPKGKENLLTDKLLTWGDVSDIFDVLQGLLRDGTELGRFIADIVVPNPKSSDFIAGTIRLLQEPSTNNDQGL
ncbi:MAG: hypothetical protein M1838_001680 [Thelocarpon superellum]|nr:MAG: hypothetical protein M1838_001680 [Thelocarpon superellum]